MTVVFEARDEVRRMPIREAVRLIGRGVVRIYRETRLSATAAGQRTVSKRRRAGTRRTKHINRSKHRKV